ncbi:phosphate ABC transporter substrate-binding protein [Desulfothermobacter acidiphilus]|uniref:phosphate ABC transporter substrate-binding protein n=1 Tax=Desulfothermobacter acidiphilus TaxID=1938353 RepID=UPI003F8869D3
MKKWWALVSVLGLLVAAVAGCGGKQPSGTTPGTATPTALKGTITIVGSTALMPLSEEAAKQFMAKNPEVQVTVQGGGSGTGLSQVSQGACDIGASDIFAQEKSGIDAAALKDHKICVQAFAVVVNPDVKGVDNLTKQQIQDIFTGKITNWKEVGGPDLKIAVINRPQGSGTRATFIKRVMDGKEPGKGVAESDSSGAIHKMVNETPGAISYLGVGYLDSKVKALKIDGAAPDEKDISEGKYTFWSYGHYYTKGEPNQVTKAFIDFVLSKEFQETTVKKLHYFPITSMKVEYKP